MASLNQWIAKGILPPGSLEALRQFASLIHSWNPKINLTGYRTLEEIEDNLLGESIAALAAVSVKNQKVLDFGSGAGIPGLVWLICEPSMSLVSLEVREKKVAFQKEALRSLALSGTILSGKFPEAVAGQQFDLIVSRGVRYDASTVKQARTLLSALGRIARFAARDAEESGWETVPISERSSLLLFK